MAIIMIDCDDCYARADRFEEMGRKYAEFARQLGTEGGELTVSLLTYSEQFASLASDIRASTDIWTDFYEHNIRLD